MEPKPQSEIFFVRLSSVSIKEIIAHMSDPRVAEHMPLLTFKWDKKSAIQFIKAKEECWQRDGLGHWAILCNGTYVGWGGFQKEDDEWDFGLVLKPECFGLGMPITRKAIQFAKMTDDIPYVTFLLPPSRTRLKALERMGAEYVTKVKYDGQEFFKYRLDTT